MTRNLIENKSQMSTSALIEKKLKRVKELLRILNRSHILYQKSSNDDRIKILDINQPLIAELSDLGIPDYYSSALIVFGNDFLNREYPSLKKKVDTLILNREDSFISAIKIFKVPSRPMTIGDKEVLEVAKSQGLICFRVVSRHYDKVENKSQVSTPALTETQKTVYELE